MKILPIIAPLCLLIVLIGCTETTIEETPQPTEVTLLPTNTLVPTATNTPVPTTPMPSVPPVPTLVSTNCTDNPAEIRWATGIGSNSSEQLKDIVTLFNDTHDCIQIIHDNISAYSLKEEIEQNRFYQLIGPVQVDDVTDFYPYFADLSAIDGWDDIDQSLFSDGTVRAYQDNGKQMGLPFLYEPQLLFVNYGLFDRAGLNYPPQKYGEMYELDGEMLPWNTETLAKVGKRLTIDHNGRNSTETGFDKKNIIQFGFMNDNTNDRAGYYTDLRGLMTLFGAGNVVDPEGQISIPTHWEDAITWYHNGMHNDIFMPNQMYRRNTIDNIAIMAHNFGYACCLSEHNIRWNTGVMPSNPEGIITSKAYRDSFHIMKDAPYQKEALYVYNWLVVENPHLLIDMYDGLPAKTALQETYFAELNEEKGYKGINWQVAIDSMAYPDIPSHEAGIASRISNEPDMILRAVKNQLRSNRVLHDDTLAQLKKDLEKINQPLVLNPPVLQEPDCSGGPVEIRWFIGLGTGTDPAQQEPQDAVVKLFNDTHDCIELIHDTSSACCAAKGILATQIKAGNTPNMVGPVGVGGSVEFYQYFADLSVIEGWNDLDLSLLPEGAVRAYQDNGKQMGLPFLYFPQILFVNYDLFDKAGLNYPPQKYGELYELDGEMLPWNTDTIAKVGKRLTLDGNGNDSTKVGFDKTNIVQFGYATQQTDLRGMMTLFGAGNVVDENGNTAIPDHWADAMGWYHNGMHNEIFIPNQAYQDRPIFDSSNYFSSGNIAMVANNLWYTCCFEDFDGAWNTGIMPSAPDGTITSKVHRDSFHIMKDAPHQEETLYVYNWLVVENPHLLIDIYGGIGARFDMHDAYFTELNIKKGYEGINWQVAIDSMAYPDVPNHEAAMGSMNYYEANMALGEAEAELRSSPDMSIDAVLTQLEGVLNELNTE